jgi:hypothetical protein
MSQASKRRHCPTAGAHDKLAEAHHFVHAMVDHYHDPDPFRYSLSAFLQAARNVTFILQSEMTGTNGFGGFWVERQAEMRADTDLKLLNDARVTVVHRSSLVPSSSMFIGHFKYGKPRAGLNMPLDPMMESIAALAYGRQTLESLEHPHRMWSGEEFGLQRKWALKEAPEKELVQFALSSLAKIAEVFSKTHEWAGFGPINSENCEHFNSTDYQNLRESEVFLEVAKAWDGPPTEELFPTQDTLALLATPSESSKVLYEIPSGKSAKGWINIQPSKFWSRHYASMLLYSIGEDVITKNTGVFFKRSVGSISTLDYPDPLEESPLEE